MPIYTEYEILNKRLVCKNAREVLNQIQMQFPDETYHSIASRASVHPQTIQRWSCIGRADGHAIKKLINSLENKEIFDDILLKDANPEQLKRQCQIVGWEKVINAKIENS